MFKSNLLKVNFLKAFTISKSLKLFLLLTSSFLGQLSCNTTEPPSKQMLGLEIIDVSCTEAWLQLTTNNIQLPVTINLLKNNSVSQIFVLNTQDSLLFIDSLLPNQTYKILAAMQQSNNASNELSVTTMDTTSHNFTWQTFEFGQHSSSVLYDVAIINENDIWAVGEIYLNDSLGNPDPLCYNALHWNGSVWELKRIKTLFRGNIISVPLEGIFAFNSTQIWLAGGLAIYGDGTNWTPFDVRLITGIDALSLSKIWGTSSNDLYFVGRNGNIAHYNGSQWKKIESGTDLNINDIWGIYNGKIGELEMLAVASNILQNNEKEVIKVNSDATQIINKEGITGTLSSIWFKNSNKYYIAGGGGVYENNRLGNINWQKSNYNFIRNFLFRLRGTDLNDIAAAGGYGDVLHFNGVSWKSYFNETQLNNGNYYSIAINSSLIITVGQDNPRAVIKIGRR